MEHNDNSHNQHYDEKIIYGNAYDNFPYNNNNNFNYENNNFGGQVNSFHGDTSSNLQEVFYGKNEKDFLLECEMMAVENKGLIIQAPNDDGRNDAAYGLNMLVTTGRHNVSNCENQSFTNYHDYDNKMIVAESPLPSSSSSKKTRTRTTANGSGYYVVDEDIVMSELDAVARLGLITGVELNSAYVFAGEICVKSGECPDITYIMMFENILMYPNDPNMDPIKRAVILYCLSLFEELQDIFCKGYNGAMTVKHQPIDKESMRKFVKNALVPCVNALSTCSESPHIFVHTVLKLVEEGGVLGYLRKYVP